MSSTGVACDVEIAEQLTRVCGGARVEAIGDVEARHVVGVVAEEVQQRGARMCNNLRNSAYREVALVHQPATEELKCKLMSQLIRGSGEIKGTSELGGQGQSASFAANSETNCLVTKLISR